MFKKSLAQKHKSPWGKDCDGKLYKNKLSHVFKTDVVKIVFGNSRAKNINVMLSVMYALLEATAKVLDIERNDIKGCLHKVKFEGRGSHRGRCPELTGLRFPNLVFTQITWPLC